MAALPRGRAFRRVAALRACISACPTIPAFHRLLTHFVARSLKAPGALPTVAPEGPATVPLKDDAMHAAAQLSAVPEPLLPALVRFGVAAAVCIVLAIGWIAAESQSHHAVDLSSLALSSNVAHVKLPAVEVRSAVR